MNKQLPEPKFIDTDGNKVLSDNVAYYEGLIGKPLEPAQIERLLINNFAFRETLLREDMQAAAKQNLVRFATFPILDYLGENVGVTRLPASAAEVDMSFVLVAGHGGVVIPVGLRVQSNDGLVVFQLTESVTVAPGVTTATGTVAAQVAGAKGNDYAIGTITKILDPQPYIVSASNSTVSGGGADDETDEQLRERIYVAPDSFGSAGHKAAYRFFAKSAHPSITDVGVLDATPSPGHVSIYPLSTLGSPTPTPVLDAVATMLNSEDVKPLNDTIHVASPTVKNFAINVQLTALIGADTVAVEALVRDNLQAYANAKSSRLGLDVVLTQISALAQVEGVYKPTVVSPVADVVAADNEVCKCTGITVTTTGTHAE